MADLTLPKTYTSAEFWEFVNLSENRDRMFERRHGEIVELMPSNPISSAIAVEFIFYLRLYLKDHPNLAHITGEQGGYDISEENTFAPDVAVILKSRQPQFPREGFNPIPPDLVVEVVSPSDKAADVHNKVQIYLRNGVKIVWVAYSDSRTVAVHTPAGSRTLTAEDTLDGGEVLPGFALKVKDVFPK
ncbi:MAG: Uma2 family endonuclease [Anaerolineae bacterium]|nr:Uma2 family endonuclease [Anaerolineae bacterium]